MYIVKDNYQAEDEISEFPVETECNQCGSVISLDKEDVHVGWLGAYHFTCPCCGEESMADEVEGITLNINNLRFPTHFLRTNKNTRHIKELSDIEILNAIKKSILYLRDNPDEFSYTISSGDTTIHINKYDNEEEYYVIVSKDFYETYIPFEEIDCANRRNCND